MFGKKKSPSQTWEHKVLTGVENALDWSAPKLGAAADWAESTYRKNAPKVQDASVRTRDAVGANAAVAAEKAKDLAARATVGLESQYDRLSPQAKAEIDKVYAKYSGAKKQLTQDYVPAASAKLGGYADKTAELIHKAEIDPRVESALIKATGDKKIIKKLRRTSEKYAKQTAKTLKKQQRSRSRKKGLLIFGLVAAGVTAGVAAWRASQPVQDPWKKPEPISATKAPSQTAKPESGAKPAQPASSVTKDAAGTERSSQDGTAATSGAATKAPSESRSATRKSASSESGEKSESEMPKPKPAT